MKRYKRTPISHYVFIGLLLLGVAALCFLSSFVMQRVPFQDQFVLPWAATRMWLLEGVSPYDDAVIALAEETLAESSYLASLPDSATLTDLAINLVFYIPFSLIPYEISRVIWLTMLIIATGAIGYLGLVLSGWKAGRVGKVCVVLMTVLWIPGVNVILTGQLTLIIILLLLLSIYLILHEEDTRVGFILSLTFGSFLTSGLILLFLLIWSISRRRWSIIVAYLSGITFLFIVTLLLIPSWLTDWLRVILDIYTDWTWIHTPLMDCAAFLPGIEKYLSIFLHVVFGIYLLTLCITLLGKSEEEFIWKFLQFLVVAFLFNIQDDVGMLLLVLPGAFLMFRFWSERWRILGFLFTWILIILLAVGSWFLVKSEDLFVEEISMPVLVVCFPILVIIGLIWIRWWAFTIPQLPFESH